MANLIYDSFKRDIGDVVDWDDNSTTDIRCMLVTSAYTPDQAHDFKNDVTNEVVGTGYVALGELVITRTAVVDGANHWAKYDADDVNWPNSSLTARGAVLYKDTGVASTSPLIAYIDFGVDKTSANGDFTIQWSVDGIFTLA